MIAVVDLLARMLAGEAVAVEDPEVRDRLEATGRVVVRRSRLVPIMGGLLSGMGRPAAAVTLGRTILVHPNTTPGSRLLRHELAHVEQWRRYPLSFPFRYTLAHIRFGYSRNPYETEARAAERPDAVGEAS